MSYTTREVEIESMSDEELEPMLHMVNLLNAEAEPRSVAWAIDELRMFSTSPGQVRRQFVVEDDSGAPVGTLTTSYADDGSNAGMLRVSMSVSPEHRRKGIGSKLLQMTVDHAIELGRSKLSSHVFDTVPAGASFAEAVGAANTLDLHMNVLKVPEIDVDLLRAWASDGPARAPGYSVQVIEGPWPDGMLGDLARLYHILERDSPSPEGHEPREWTADLLKEMVSHYFQGMDSLMAVAIHEETDTPVGMSHLVRRHTDHRTWIVTTTMVDPEHRGHALGKWVKAAVNLEALEKWPGAEWAETGNAFANDPMLGINRAMGFEHESTMTIVEVEVERAMRYLRPRLA